MYSLVYYYSYSNTKTYWYPFIYTNSLSIILLFLWIIDHSSRKKISKPNVWQKDFQFPKQLFYAVGFQQTDNPSGEAEHSNEEKHVETAVLIRKFPG